VPGSVTIDGSLSNGKYVTLQKRDMSKNYPSLTFSGGNNILTNIFIDHANLASAVAIGNGENYWFHQFRIHNPNDDNLTIGNPRSNVTSSADSITISRYQVLPGASKGVLLNSGGASCKGDSGRTGSDVGLNQRRLRVTILSSELRAGTRNILNKGGYAEIINTYINGRVENSITRLGGQTLIRCSYVDSQTVRSKGIGVDEGFYESGGTSVSPSFCPQQSEVFLADNLYIQENYPEPSKQPRINLSSSSIKAGKNGYITNNLENWLKPTGGRPAFERNYSSNVSLFCANDNPVKSVGAGPNFKLDPVCE